MLALCYAASLLYDVPAASTARCLALIVWVGLCAFGHIVNAAFDIEADHKARKPNHMAGFALWQRFAFCALTRIDPAGNSATDFMNYTSPLSSLA